MSEWHGDMALVADLCGEEVAEALVEHVRGVLLYVSKNPGKNSLMHRLPEDIAERLVAEFAGNELYISSKRATTEQTAEKIEELIDQGLTVPEVALHMGLCAGWVRECRRNHGAPRLPDKVHPNQLNFFETDAS